MISLRCTYKYRLYRCDKRDRYLHHQIDVAGCIWNHALALQRRYYRLTGKYISSTALKSHIAKLRKHAFRYSKWRMLNSQSVQDVLERLDYAYQRFFSRLANRPPKFKKISQYQSFTLKQNGNGWALLGSKESRYGKIRIGKYQYKYVKHREMDGVVKTVTIKRDALKRLRVQVFFPGNPTVW